MLAEIFLLRLESIAFFFFNDTATTEIYTRFVPIASAKPAATTKPADRRG